MLVSALCLLITVLIVALFIQNSRFKRKRPMIDNTVPSIRENTNRVAYLEPMVNVTTFKQELAEPSLEEAEDCGSEETADDILGIAVHKEKSDNLNFNKNKDTDNKHEDYCHDEAQNDQVNSPSSQRPLMEFIILYLRSPEDKPYAGYELLQALLSTGLRYGKSNIFHRFESNTSKAKSLFSLSSSVQPGTFDLPGMGGYSTPALSLFFKPTDTENPMKVFELMLNAVGQLSEDLGGEVLDSNRKLLTKETVREMCLEIHRYEKQVNNLDLFVDA